MRTQQPPSTRTSSSKAEADDLVYFRFGKNGEEDHLKVRTLSSTRGCTMASVMRELIKRGLADLEMEQAIVAAHKSSGSASAVAVGL